MNRTPGGRFLPGASGNPKGRPRAGGSIIEWENGMANWLTADIVAVSEAPDGDPAIPHAKRVAAVRLLQARAPNAEGRHETAEICDRTVGRPTARVEVGVVVSKRIIFGPAGTDDPFELGSVCPPDAFDEVEMPSLDAAPLPALDGPEHADDEIPEDPLRGAGARVRDHAPVPTTRPEQSETAKAASRAIERLGGGSKAPSAPPRLGELHDAIRRTYTDGDDGDGLSGVVRPVRIKEQDPRPGTPPRPG